MDIYFQDGYGKLYEEIEGGIAEIFNYESSLGEIKHQFIRREIPINLSDGKKYYDLITPYGYGGPLVLSSVNNNRDELCKAFGIEFQNYCYENNIVSEFIRFHPIYNNALDFQEIYKPICIRKTLGTNLKEYDDPIQSEFSKGCRKNIRQALNKGVTYRINKEPDNIDNFIDIYYSTMQRDKASDFYYFGEDYFNGILNNFKKNVIYVEAIYQEKTIAAGLYFISDDIIHAHLSGTLNDYLYLSPAYIIKYATAFWGKKNGYNMIHYGGGTSSSPDDSLFLFKKKFSQNTEFDFYIGKKIWNKEVYLQLCREKSASPDSDFFPAYRVR